MSEMTTKRFLDRAEVESIYSIKKSYLEHLAYIGGGPAFSKCGTRCLYDVVLLEEWLAERRRTSTSDLGT